MKTESIELIEMGRIGNPRLDNWNNRVYFGDNLKILESLLSSDEICGRVKLIYIDPPFSTNQEYRSGDDRTATVSKSNIDKLAYDDLLIGDEYINFLKERLVLLHKILAKDGSIYIHIDLKIGHYVKVLVDEIFGKENFINHITRIKCNPKNFARRAFGNISDMILFYSKTKSYIWNEPRAKVEEADIERLFPKIDAQGRRYTTTPLHAPGETRNGVTGKTWKGLLPPKGRHWRYKPEVLDMLDIQGLIEWSNSGNPRKIIYADEIKKNGKRIQDIWYFPDPIYPKYPTEKNFAMIKLIVETSSNPNDLVLDCFAGSGTTLIVSEMLGRRWIGIDDSQVAVGCIRERLESNKKLTTTLFYNTT